MRLTPTEVLIPTPDPDTHNPSPYELAELLDAFIFAVQGTTSGALIRSTLAELYTIPDPAEGTMAWVTSDPTPGYNGVYGREGLLWQLRAPLPYGVVRLTNSGLGTGDAIEATSAVLPTPSPFGVLYFLEADKNNTGAVSLSVNGQPSKPVRSNNGVQVTSANYITDGMLLLLTEASDHYRLVTLGDVDTLPATIQNIADSITAIVNDATIRFRDAWNVTTTYETHTHVSHNGSLWGALADNTGNEPSDSSAFWERILTMFDGSNPLTEKLVTSASTVDAAALRIPSGAEPIAKTDGDIWRGLDGSVAIHTNGFDGRVMVSNQPASFPPGMVIRRRVATRNTALTALATELMTNDDSVPLATNGALLMSGDYYPQGSTHTFELDGVVPLSAAEDGEAAVAVFMDGVCVGATMIWLRAGKAMNARISSSIIQPFGSVGVKNFTVRFGATSYGQNIYAVSRNGTRYHGGQTTAFLSVIEMRD